MGSDIVNRESVHTDFFKTEAQTPLGRQFRFCGKLCEIRTNSEAILMAASESLCLAENEAARPDLCMRFWVDYNDTGDPPWPKPYVRGLGQLVFAGFDTGSSLLIDLRSRRCIGRFSRQMSADRHQWREVILPMILSIVSGSLGIAEVHCACVARNTRGLLLSGPSGSGKSTLSIALGLHGFSFLSDDRTFCFLQRENLVAWGLPILSKLRFDATTWFPELRESSTETWKDKQVFRFEIGNRFGVQRVRECEPAMIVFLDRCDARQFRLERLSWREAAQRLQQEMMAESSDTIEAQATMIAKVADLQSWRLQYGGPLREVVERLALHFEEYSKEVGRAQGG
jgi:hypothetical protein